MLNLTPWTGRGSGRSFLLRKNRFCVSAKNSLPEVLLQCIIKMPCILMSRAELFDITKKPMRIGYENINYQ